MKTPVFAIDVGYGNTKSAYRAASGTIATSMFPSLAPLAASRSLALHGEGVLAARKVANMIVDHVEYEVGPDVSLTAAYGNTGRALSDNYAALLGGSLHFSGVTHIERLVLGLPVHNMQRYSADLKERFAGDLDFGHNRVTVEKVVVIPQPLGSLVLASTNRQTEFGRDELERAQQELARREQLRPRTLSAQERHSLLALGRDLQRLWDAPTLTVRDRKQLLRTLLEEVSITVHREQYQAHVKLRWRGGKLTECDVALPRSRPATIRTDEDTLALVRRLAQHYPDGTIAGILNAQGRLTARGLRFNQNLVGNLRRHWNIPCFEQPAERPDGELLSIRQAARALGTAPSTLHRWVNDGFIAGEQTTPGAPWRIRITDALRSRFVEHSPEGYVVMQDATKLLGVSRQTVLQRVKRGELDAVLVCSGRRKGLRIKAVSDQTDLFEHSS